MYMYVYIVYKGNGPLGLASIRPLYGPYTATIRPSTRFCLYIGFCQVFENLRFLRKLSDFLYLFWKGVTLTEKI